MDTRDVPVPGLEQPDLDTTAVREPPRASRDLRREHVHVLRMLKVLEAIRPRLAQGESLPSDDWESIVTFLRVFVDRCHHGKEERVLFPALVQVADDQTRTLVEELLVEHVEGRQLVAALAAAVGAGPTLPGAEERHRGFDQPAADAAIEGYVALIRPHVLSEEERLFPFADASLAPEFQETLQGEYDRIEYELTGAVSHEAFADTVARLKERYLPRPGR
jgi:hemerythrin-like domain-containing protein